MTLPKNRQSVKQIRREVALKNMKKNLKEKAPPEYKSVVEGRIAHLETVIENSSSGAIKTKKRREDKRKI